MLCLCTTCLYTMHILCYATMLFLYYVTMLLYLYYAILTSSLNYAITHMTNYTVILILCGTHELKPFDDSSPDSSPLSNVKRLSIMGECTSGSPQIHCTNGANLAFYKVQAVKIIDIAFNNCGEQLQYSDSLSRSSVLYIQDCNTVLIALVNITIAGPYGRGISFIRDNETAVADEDVRVTFHFVSIYHYGFHGSGIHCEIVTGSRATDTPLPSPNLQMIQQNIKIFNVHFKNSLTVNFIGINITVMGDGESGRISQTNITVVRNTSGTDTSISLLDNVSKFQVQLVGIFATDLSTWKKMHNSSNGTLTLASKYIFFQKCQDRCKQLHCIFQYQD